jgi:hypothetical protein
MKRAKTIVQIPAINANIKYKTNERDELNLDNLLVGNRDELEDKLQEIEERIDEIGKLCDRKKQRSYEDCVNVIKTNKSKEQEVLSRLNFDLLETIKQNTKEDYLNGLKKEVGVLKSQVDDKDKELSANNAKLYTFENKINYLKDEKKYLKKELRNSKTYNMYLKSRLKELELPQAARVETSQHGKVLDTTKQVAAEQPSSIEVSEKLELYLKRNENILLNKIASEEKVYQDRISTLKNLEMFNNPILEILASKLKEYQMNTAQAKITNEDVFFGDSIYKKNSLSNSSMKVYCDLIFRKISSHLARTAQVSTMGLINSTRRKS